MQVDAGFRVKGLGFSGLVVFGVQGLTCTTGGLGSRMRGWRFCFT